MGSCTIIIKNKKGKTIRKATLHTVDEVRNFYYEVCKEGIFDDNGDGPYFRGNLEDIEIKEINTAGNWCACIPLHESESHANGRTCKIDLKAPNRLKAIAYAFSQSVPCLDTENTIIVGD